MNWPILLDMLARHRYMLWFMLGIGIWNLLLLTVLYPCVIRWAAVMLRFMSRSVRQAAARQNDPVTALSIKLQRWQLKFMRRHYRSAWMYAFGMLQTLAVLGMSITGLILTRPP